MSKPLSPRVVQLCNDIINGSLTARHKLVQEYDPFIRKKALQMARKTRLPFGYRDDAICACRLAAYEKVVEFNPELSHNFAAFIRYPLENAVYQFAGQMAYGTYFPQNIVRDFRRIYNAEVRLQKEGVDKPDILQLASASGAKVSTVFFYKNSRNATLPAIELDAPIGTGEDGNNVTRLDYLLSTDLSASDEYHQGFERSKILAQALTILSPREERVIRLNVLGVANIVLDDREVAAQLGCSHQNVSLIRKAAIQKLTVYMKHSRLRFADLVAG